MSRAALSAALLSAGCGDEPAGIETEAGFEPQCIGEPEALVTGFTPDPPVDYLELAHSGGIDATVGAPCAGASDVPACTAALAALPGDEFAYSAGMQAFVPYTIHATRGDDAITVGTSPTVLEFLAPIDTPAEAFFVTLVSGHLAECGRSGALPVEGGHHVQLIEPYGCDGRRRLLFEVTREGAVTQLSAVTEKKADPNCIVGRRPVGLRRARHAQDPGTIGGYLARASALEAASVAAFERLERELRAHGAPRSLLDRARAAACDEVHHARIVRALSRRFGGDVEAPRVRRGAVRDLGAIALENATEGCVRETYGALVAEWQSLRATEPTVRAAFRRIARDEYRHAALSWRVARWVEPRLAPAARRRVERARREAVRQLHAELEVEPSREVRTLGGLPDAPTARRLASGLFDVLGLGAG